MECSSCGAPMRPIRHGQYFFCEQCSGFFFPHASEDGVVVAGAPAERDCPVCQLPLVQASVEGTPVAHCTRCEGILASIAAFRFVVETLQALHAGPRLPPTPIAPEEWERHIPCPGCYRIMDLHPYYGPGNVMIDSCFRCRLIWLDRGELAVIGHS